MHLIPYGKQYLDKSDYNAVVKSLKEHRITEGKYVKSFEKILSKKLRVKYGLSCNSGTSAIFMALVGLGIKKNDTIIVPSINFLSIINVSNLLNLKIYMADVDESTGQMTPKNLLNCIKKNNIKNVHTVVTMYLGGSCENNIEFYKLKKKFNFNILEDACHALGTSYNSKKKLYHIGSCKHSDVCCFSFHPLKSITTGEGGFITTNKKKIINKALLARAHGIMKSNKHWKYDLIFSSLNFRLSDINASLGISQTKKLNFFVKKRKEVFKKYKNFFKDFKEKVYLPKYDKKINSCNHLFIINLNLKKIGITKDNIIKKFKNRKIILQYHYTPFFKYPFLKNKIINFNDNFPGSKKYYKSAISLPIFVNLRDRDFKRIKKCFRDILV